MIKKLTKHGNSWALIIDKPVLDLLNINPETMTDSAKYNGYVYVLENDQTKDKDYSLKVVFRYSWNRA